jgi:2-polyprenyl-6-methoxyphenol hydroxylase-like FAD-dependent oxidoreductase
MTLALELARAEVETVLVDRKPGLDAVGSKAIVMARHAIEILDRVGCGARVVQKGVALARARTYYRDKELFCVEFPPARAGEIPRFLNLQQTHTERFLWERVRSTHLVDTRWGTELTALRQDDHRAFARFDGRSDEQEFAYVVGCDGAGSAVRRLAGIEFPGRTFGDRFLIADLRAELSFPHERRFFFDPPSNPGRQILIHPQPDAEWRIDWQVAPETDAEEERRSGRLDRRIRRLIGPTPYALAWLTGYRFHERVADRFRSARVMLAGDAAHVFAPFGARGMNSGLEDAANLGWKLAMVIHGEADEPLLDTYEAERRPAALENLRVTSATMRFMAPPTPLHGLVRNVTLRGSPHVGRLRRRVDSGRLAEPAVHAGQAPVGRLAPAGAPRRELSHGFTAASIGGVEYVVRPDGYVTAELEGDDENAVRSGLSRLVPIRPRGPARG